MRPKTRELIVGAFTALGPAPSWEELGLVTEMLHAAGDQDLEDAFADAAGDRGEERQSTKEIYEIARETEAHAFTALDLITAMTTGIIGPRRTKEGWL